MPCGVEHEHMQPGIQPRELRVEMPLLFRDGERHGLERMKLDADKHQRHGQRETARPRQARTPGRFAARIPALRGADCTRTCDGKSFQYSSVRSGTRNAFQFGFQFKIVHRAHLLFALGMSASVSIFVSRRTRATKRWFPNSPKPARPRRDSVRRKSSARWRRAVWRAISARRPALRRPGFR